MTLSPPTNACIDPRRRGLTLVRVFYGVVRDEPRELPVITGDVVRDSSGQLFRFVGLDASRQMILAPADDDFAFEQARQRFEQSRWRHEGEGCNDTVNAVTQ